MLLLYVLMSSTHMEVVMTLVYIKGYLKTTVIWLWWKSVLLTLALFFLHSSMLKLEECLLCCGVVVVSCMGEIKLNLLNSVCLNLEYIWLYTHIYIFYHCSCIFCNIKYVTCFIVHFIRWVPPWSWRVFCGKRDREGDILTFKIFNLTY